MAWLQLRVHTRHPEFADEVLQAHGASAVSFVDAVDDPVLEPAPGETPLWQNTVTLGLFGGALIAGSIAGCSGHRHGWRDADAGEFRVWATDEDPPSHSIPPAIAVKAAQRQEAERSRMRRTQVGTGDRSAKIRTYNFSQSRITDHRIGFTTHDLAGVLNGDLAPVVNALRVASVDDEQVTVDGNHPLAGQTLHFAIEVADVRAATADEVEHRHAHGAHGHHHH